MRSRVLVLFVGGGLACSTPEPPGTSGRTLPPPVTPDDTGGSPSTDTGPADCDFAIIDSEPSDGEVDVFYRDDVIVSLAAAPDAATIEVADRDGNVVPGDTTVIDTDVVWSGDPLTPNTRHTATLSVDGCEDRSVSFLVSSTGLPAGNVDEHVYGIDLGSGVWTEPPGVGFIVGKLLPVDTLWISPDLETDEITMLGAFVDIFGDQAECLPTFPFPTVPYDDPYFLVSTPALAFEAYGAIITLRDVSLTGAFAPNGARIDALDLSGTLDVREVEPFVNGLDLCLVVQDFGRSCFACLDGEDTCVRLTVEDLDAALVPGVVIEERTPAMIAGNPYCATFP